AAGRRRLVRDGDALGHHPGRQLQGDRQAGVPHGAAAPPLRARWLAGDDGDRAVVDRRRALHRPRARVVLRGLPSHTGCHRMTIEPRRALVYGFATTGRSAARALVKRDRTVIIVDDHPSDDARDTAQLMGMELVEAPSRAQLRTLLD